MGNRASVCASKEEAAEETPPPSAGATAALTGGGGGCGGGVEGGGGARAGAAGGPRLMRGCSMPTVKAPGAGAGGMDVGAGAACLPPTAASPPPQHRSATAAAISSTAASGGASNGRLLNRRFKVSDKVIGKGSFATVTLGVDTKTKRKVAVRTIPTDGLCPVTLEHVRREAELHPLLQHENIVKCLWCASEPAAITMVLEYVKDGSLLDFYARRRSLLEFEARNLFLQLVDAVEYMHSVGVCHRDIKLDNILVDAGTMTIKLADMGFADRFDTDTLFRNFPGTLAYSPPEVLRGEPHRAVPRDVWSCGVLLYILLTGKYPFGSQPNSKTKSRILNEEPNWAQVKSETARDLLQRMLHKDPTKRATLREALAHPWCKEGSVFRRHPLLRRASSLAGNLVPQPADKRPEKETLLPAAAVEQLAGAGAAANMHSPMSVAPAPQPPPPPVTNTGQLANDTSGGSPGAGITPLLLAEPGTRMQFGVGGEMPPAPVLTAGNCGSDPA